MRILVGTVEVSGLLIDFVEGFRRLGHQVTSVIADRNSFYPTHRYDVDLSHPVPWPVAIDDTPSPLIRVPRGAIDRIVHAVRLLQFIRGHDVFVFLWGGRSLTRGNREFPLLKRLRKQTVSIFLGSDVRHVPSFLQQYQRPDVSAEFVQELRSRMLRSPLRPLYALRVAEKFSDLILSQPNQSNLAVRPYMHLYLPIQLSRYRHAIPGREVPLVVHAPSSRPIKGSDRILATLDSLKRDGVRFELRVFDDVPNEQVISALADADVVIDQLYSAGYGKLGLESMASGCALASRSYDAFWPYSPEEPIWHIDSSKIYPQLKRMLTDRMLRIQLAITGRQFVERYHDHIEVARRILLLLTRDRTQTYDHYPEYFARDFRLGKGEEFPEHLKRVTGEIIQNWGLPEGVDPADLVERGLISFKGLNNAKPIGRWKSVGGRGREVSPATGNIATDDEWFASAL